MSQREHSPWGECFHSVFDTFTVQKCVHVRKCCQNVILQYITPTDLMSLQYSKVMTGVSYLLLSQLELKPN